jgi:cysteinyl-tRNA synthetase
MSKSSGEFLTVSLLESKGYDPLAYRYFCLQSHYRKSLVFSYENLDNATTAYNKLIARLAQLEYDGEIDAAAFAEGKKKFTDALDNDLNTSLAVTALYDVLKLRTNGATKLALVADFDKVLSIGLVEAANKARELKKAEASKQSTSPEYDMNDPFVCEILDLIEQRKQAKKDKNFAEADRIRAYLESRGVTIKDTREGTSFKIG